MSAGLFRKQRSILMKRVAVTKSLKLLNLRKCTLTFSISR